MSRNIRWVIILTGGIAAAGTLIYCYAVSAAYAASDVAALIVERQWLAGILALYGINFAVAAKIRNSFGWAAGRMLFFAAAAFIVLSHGIDILGEHRAELWKIFGFEASAPDLFMDSIRARLAAAAATLTLCLICIAVGFETEEKENPAPKEA